jgi:alpha 1,2-mannosyltransferase
LSEIWGGLRTLFDANVPTPSRIPHPKLGDDFPFKDGLRDVLGLTKAEFHSTRLAHMQVRRSLPDYPSKRFKGRGIIMLAGGKYSEYAATSLGMLRSTGSQLPVEVWMKDESEEMPGWCAELEKEGMACRRLADYMDMSVLTHPYQWKVFVMLFSSFEEFIFLDADDMPIQNPDVIFSSEVYNKYGAILWPDYWPHSGSPWLPYVIGISDDNTTMLEKTRSAESGQVVWNKRKHWKVHSL